MPQVMKHDHDSQVPGPLFFHLFISYSFIPALVSLTPQTTLQMCFVCMYFFQLKG